MLRFFIYFFCVLNLTHLCAQELNPLWETHFSYYNVNGLESDGINIYASSENAVFLYNIQTDELNKITTKEGLSGETISSIYFSSNYNKLMIGFENGLIQIKD